jgi:hypothetical protein
VEPAASEGDRRHADQGGRADGDLPALVVDDVVAVRQPVSIEGPVRVEERVRREHGVHEEDVVRDRARRANRHGAEEGEDLVAPDADTRPRPEVRDDRGLELLRQREARPAVPGDADVVVPGEGRAGLEVHERPNLDPKCAVRYEDHE